MNGVTLARLLVVGIATSGTVGCGASAPPAPQAADSVVARPASTETPARPVAPTTAPARATFTPPPPPPPPPDGFEMVGAPKALAHDKRWWERYSPGDFEVEMFFCRRGALGWADDLPCPEMR